MSLAVALAADPFGKPRAPLCQPLGHRHRVSTGLGSAFLSSPVVLLSLGCEPVACGTSGSQEKAGERLGISVAENKQLGMAEHALTGLTSRSRCLDCLYVHPDPKPWLLRRVCRGGPPREARAPAPSPSGAWDAAPPANYQGQGQGPDSTVTRGELRAHRDCGVAPGPRAFWVP